MSSAGDIILKYVCPTLGVIIGNLMFSAPYRSVKDAVARGFLGDLNPTPWAMMTGNCIGWVTYSILLQDYFIWIANAPGFVLSIWLNLCAAKLQYQESRSKEMRKSFVHFLEQERRRSSIAAVEEAHAPKQHQDWQSAATDLGKLVVQVTSQEIPAPAPHERIVVIVVLFWTIVISVITLADLQARTRELTIGIINNLFLCFFYGAPLLTIFTVLRKRNSASIHIRTMITNTLNGAFWMAYGLGILDPFIAVPNGIGAGLGVIQFLLCFMFPRISVETEIEEADDEDGIEAGDEQLAGDDEENKPESPDGSSADATEEEAEDGVVERV